MSDILYTAGAVLTKTRYAWEIPLPHDERFPRFHHTQGQIVMNKKSHTTRDVPGGHPGGYANDHNKSGEHPQTPLHQDQRTPASRSDRDDHLGSDNQSQRRKHGPQRGG
jgi:hypothetical protein